MRLFGAGCAVMVLVIGCGGEAAPPDASMPRDAERPDASDAGRDAATECDEPDRDGDGHASTACGGDDCDDSDPDRFPGNLEVCDEHDHDEDCDPTTYGSRDADGDGHDSAVCCNVRSDGARFCGSDCDDHASNVHPTAPEVCNGFDDNCNGAIDEGVLRTFYRDADNDGYGCAACGDTRMACNPPAGYVESSTDCDDELPSVRPGADELCNGRDDDCDGAIDGAPAAARCGLAPSAASMACTDGACEIAGCVEGWDDCDGITSNGCEIEIASDVRHCGACAASCPAIGGTPSCSMGTCGYSACSRPEDVPCGGACVVSDVTHCGPSCEVCVAPIGGSVACTGGSCVESCPAGQFLGGSRCHIDTPPRPTAPLSTSVVTSRQPTFRWALPAGVDGARVEICRDRGCAVVVAAFDAMGTSGRPSAELPTGVLFWRSYGRSMGFTSPRASVVTWQLTVGARSASVDTSFGTVPDFDGDGLADVLVGADGAAQAFVFRGTSAGLSTSASATLSGGSQFGRSVACAGDVNGDGFADAIVGAPGASQATVFLGSAAGLRADDAVTLHGPSGTSFGFTVSSAGDVNGDGYADVIVGGGGSRAFVYHGGPSGPPASASTTIVGAVVSFGSSVAHAGDVNGDGYGDVIVGAVGANQAFVFHGGPDGVVTSTPRTFTGTLGTRYGEGVASAGDVNGDGYGDIAIGANGASQAFVHLGGPSGVSMTVGTTLTGTASTSFGFSLGSAFDVNGDGYGDLVVGAFQGNQAFVFHGGPSGLSPSSSGTIGVPFTVYGYSVAGAGDVTGDGFGDVIVGAVGDNRAHLYHGGPSGISTTPARSLSGTGNFGRSVAQLAPTLLGLVRRRT